MKKARLLLLISLVFLAILPLNGSAAAQTGTMVYVYPALTEVEPGNPFSVDVMVANIEELWAFDITVSYDIDYLTFISAELGDFLSQGISFGCGEVEDSPDEIQCINTQNDGEPPKYGSGTLFKINFVSKQEEAYTYLSISEPTVDDPGLVDRNGRAIPFTSQDGDVKIGDAEPGFEAFIPVFLH
ncbi:hypothetical protein JR338_08560 [Chloroflexota bacterium]|nr:hypothetical protein JR338_08560 [Chloroflexota bacterium]